MDYAKPNILVHMSVLVRFAFSSKIQDDRRDVTFAESNSFAYNLVHMVNWNTFNVYYFLFHRKSKMAASVAIIPDCSYRTVSDRDIGFALLALACLEYGPVVKSKIRCDVMFDEFHS